MDQYNKVHYIILMYLFITSLTVLYYFILLFLYGFLWPKHTVFNVCHFQIVIFYQFPFLFHKISYFISS